MNFPLICLAILWTSSISIYLMADISHYYSTPNLEFDHLKCHWSSSHFVFHYGSQCPTIASAAWGYSLKLSGCFYLFFKRWWSRAWVFLFLWVRLQLALQVPLRRRSSHSSSRSNNSSDGRAAEAYLESCQMGRRFCSVRCDLPNFSSPHPTPTYWTLA